jgi:hypothetical protein
MYAIYARPHQIVGQKETNLELEKYLGNILGPD